jgi:hypothetical protein
MAAVSGSASFLGCLVAGLAVTGCTGLLDLDVHYTGVDASALDAASTATPASDSGPDATQVTPPGTLDASGGGDATSALDAAGDAPSSGDAAGDAPGPPRPGGIQYVQGNAGANVNNQATVSVTLPQPVTAGDAIVVAVDATSDQMIAVSDTLGSQYTIAYSTDDGNGIESGIAYALDVAGGTAIVTFTIDTTNPVQFLEVYVHEFSGIAVPDGATGMSGTSMDMHSGPVTTTAAHDLIFAFGATGRASAGNGFTPLLDFNANLSEYAIQTAAGPIEATETMNSGIDWILTMAAFKPRP